MKRNELLSNLASNDGTKEMVRSCIEAVLESKGIIIFGAGVGGGHCMTS